MGTLGRLLLPAIPSSAAAAAITTSVDDALQDVAREVKQVAHGVEERFELAEVKMRETAGTAVAALMDRVDSVRIAGAAIGDGADAAVANVSSFSKRTTVLAVAWCIHNISFPARVGITAVLAPYVGARLRGGRIEKMMKKGFEMARAFLLYAVLNPVVIAWNLKNTEIQSESAVGQAHEGGDYATQNYTHKLLPMFHWADHSSGVAFEAAEDLIHHLRVVDGNAIESVHKIQGLDLPRV
ncbi:hypothetical protein HDU82_002207 [Entophlyctis luteolus]|nr:hypothetical protein HDU82_002207 [Entophlyctis luteolus]